MDNGKFLIFATGDSAAPYMAIDTASGSLREAFVMEASQCVMHCEGTDYNLGECVAAGIGNETPKAWRP